MAQQTVWVAQMQNKTVRIGYVYDDADPGRTIQGITCINLTGRPAAVELTLASGRAFERRISPGENAQLALPVVRRFLHDDPTLRLNLAGEP